MPCQITEAAQSSLRKARAGLKPMREVPGNICRITGGGHGKQGQSGKTVCSWPTGMCSQSLSMYWCPGGGKILSGDMMLPGPTESIYWGHGEGLSGQFQDYSMYEVADGEIRAFYTLEN